MVGNAPGVSVGSRSSQLGGAMNCGSAKLWLGLGTKIDCTESTLGYEYTYD